MKKFVLIIAIILLGLNSTEPLKASAPSSTTGRWAGTAFANPAFDFNGDGIFGRTFVLNVYDNLRFVSLEGVVDSALVSVGVCAPGAFELQAFGTITFRSRTGDSLYAEVPADAPHLCFDPANPSEVLQVAITGGTGAFANATGTGTLNVHDVVRLAVPVNLPGFGVVPAPTMVDSHGEFTLSFQ